MNESNVSGIVIQLTSDEAEWLVAVLGLVMQLARKWDGNIATDYGNHLLAVLNLARIREADRALERTEQLQNARQGNPDDHQRNDRADHNQP